MTDEPGRPASWRAMVDAARAFSPAIPPLALAAWSAYASPAGVPWIGLVVAACASGALVVWSRAALARRLSTVSSVLSAFRDGDFSIRARAAKGDSLLSEVLYELNHLGDKLREHRLGEIEAWALLRKVMGEVDVLVLAFDDASRLKLANAAATRVLGGANPTLLGRDAAALGIGDLLSGPAPRVVRDSGTLGVGPWELRRGTFRLAGEPHTLIVLSDVSSALREQEREAWKRLIRVMGHEINNSLAPIQSMSGNLETLLGRSPRHEGWEQDMAGGLSVIARRSEALGRFMAAYARLARLPPPRMAKVGVAEWIRRTAALEQRVTVEVTPGPDVSLHGDADQLDQLLINLVKNAAEATLERGNGGVRIRWEVEGQTLRVLVEDDGPGVSETTNLFVPFFTTKPGGSGIGLALARQIAEGHGGQASLETRPDGGGALAVVRLPTRGGLPEAPQAVAAEVAR